MSYYEQLLNALNSYFSIYADFHYSNWKSLFLHGGCYWFADLLHQRIPDSDIMICRMEEHCALYFEHGLYDVSGKISSRFFRPANDRDINFMKKNYIPKFDTKKLEQYLQTRRLL